MVNSNLFLCINKVFVFNELTFYYCFVTNTLSRLTLTHFQIFKNDYTNKIMSNSKYLNTIMILTPQLYVINFLPRLIVLMKKCIDILHIFIS